jgi:hypothetical protein
MRPQYFCGGRSIVDQCQPQRSTGLSAQSKYHMKTLRRAISSHPCDRILKEDGNSYTLASALQRKQIKIEPTYLANGRLSSAERSRQRRPRAAAVWPGIDP